MKKLVRRDRAAADVSAAGTASPGWGRFAQGLAGSVVALFVAAPLIPCESAALLGTHVVLVMAWFPVAVGCLVWQWRRSGFPRVMGLVDGVVWLFLLVQSVSALVMLRAGQPRSTLNAMWLWIAYGLMYYCVRQLFGDGRAQRAAISALIAVAVGVSVFGFYQVSYSNPRQRAEYAKDPEAELKRAEMDAPAGSPLRAHLENRVASTEPIGSFALTNSLAGYLTPAVLLLASILGSYRERATRSGPRALGMLVLMLVLVGCLVLTKSRSAYAAVIVGVTLLAIFRALPRTWFRGSLLLGAAVLAIVTTITVVRLGGLDREVITEAPKSLLYRLQYWRATCDMIGDHPWFGCGLGNFKAYYTRYKAPEASEEIADPHNFLLEIAATAGLPSLGLFLLVGALFTRTVWRRRGASAASAANRAATRAEELVSISPNSIYAGVVAGFLLAFPAGWVGGIAPDLMLLATALPAAGVTLWWLHAWVLRGDLTVWSLVVAGVALLVNLLAAGGIGYPGVGQLVWWLVALTLSTVTVVGRPGDGDGQSRGVWRPAAALAIGLLLAGACYLTMYRPVLAARQCLGEAQRTTSMAASERSMVAAAEADPWWGAPWEMLADLRSQRWMATRDESHLQAFFACQDALLERNRHSSSMERRCGDWLLEMYAASRRADLGALAVRAYARAVELYPNSGILHAQLAWTYHVTGDQEGARRHAEEALRLDALTPHSELKLVHQRLVADFLLAPGGGDEPRHDGPAPTGWNVEQWMQQLRKVKDR
ncbi:MAG: O-antigen ligase family protein [Pirellulaceae bacterium]